VHALTGKPLIGLTLAGDGAWSARTWDAGGRLHYVESVRVINSQLQITWNDNLRPPLPSQPTQLRTVSGWGPGLQAQLARTRILVVGSGSVGLDVAIRLAATGIGHVAVMDYDSIEIANLDRMPTATLLDVYLGEGKVEHARRQLRRASTAAAPELQVYEQSICEPEGQAIALDYDVTFSCVDRPWPRAVLNQLAYSDLIPVIDGGIAIDPFPDGNGMRNATWRSHVIRPGRPCMVCNGQLDVAEVPRDRQGLLDDAEYIRRPGRSGPARPNVALLSINVVASLLAQFVSLTVAPRRPRRGRRSPVRALHPRPHPARGRKQGVLSLRGGHHTR
jgi:molybdopterin-synthase adenylyltransferase